MVQLFHDAVVVYSLRPARFAVGVPQFYFARTEHIHHCRNMIVPSTRHLVLASSIGFALVSRATGLTYWIDQTCDNQLPGVEDEYKVYPLQTAGANRR